MQGKDVFLFNSGDIVDGTGLAGATPVDGAAILPIVQQVRFLQRGASATCSIFGHALCQPLRRLTSTDLAQMPFAAITCGNHELYINSTIENLAQVLPDRAPMAILAEVLHALLKRAG